MFRGPNEGENRGEEHVIRKSNEKTQTTKGAHYDRLTVRLELIVIVVQRRLLADAEFREYLDENIVVGDFACDGAQVVDDLADVFA